MPARHLFVRLLTGALLQTLLAPLHCLAYGAMRDTVMVAEDGPRVPLVRDGEDRNPASRPAEHASSFSLSAGSAPPSVVPTIVPVFGAALPTAWQEAPDPAIRLGASAPPFDATGPPSLLFGASDHPSQLGRVPIVKRERVSL